MIVKRCFFHCIVWLFLKQILIVSSKIGKKGRVSRGEGTTLGIIFANSNGIPKSCGSLTDVATRKHARYAIACNYYVNKKISHEKNC